MGIQFSWFKIYTIDVQENPYGWDPRHDGYRICFGDDGGSVSLGYGSTDELQTWLDKVTGNIIPHISETTDFEKPEYIDAKLCKPADMSALLDKVLNHKDTSEDIKDRLKWFKKLSDEGFYIAYE